MVTCIVTLDNIVLFDTIVLWEYQQLLASSFQLIYISKPDYRYNERVWLYNTCLVLSMMTTAYICFVITSHTTRNEDQKLVCCFYEYRIFYRLLIAVPLQMYRKFGQPKQILVGQMLKLVRKWPMVN